MNYLNIIIAAIQFAPLAWDPPPTGRAPEWYTVYITPAGSRETYQVRVTTTQGRFPAVPPFTSYQVSCGRMGRDEEFLPVKYESKKCPAVRYFLILPKHNYSWGLK